MAALRGRGEAPRQGRLSRLGALALLLLVAGCGAEETPSPPPAPAAAEPEPEPPPFAFTDVAEEAGLRLVTWCGRPEKPHLLESGGNGLALLDYDADGDLDVYLVNGWRLDGSRVVEKGRNALYRNRGDGTFEDVTAAAGVGDDGWGCGVAVGDYDGDGRPDLFVTNFGPDVLYRNRGDGRFDRVPDAPGIDGWSAAAVFFDADGDGDEDLFVGGYVDCTLDEVLHAKPTLTWKKRKVMPGPFGLEGLANRYFRNDGADGFREATEESGLIDVGLFFSFGVAALDVDGDLDLDLYVANDSNPNYLYVNRGGGRFEETGLWSGAAQDAAGASQAGMGIATGDYDADGRTDLFVTHFADDYCTLYRNLGGAVFDDVTQRSGVRGPTFAPLSWGTVFADFDLDGDLDLFVANGHIYPQADDVEGSSFEQANLLLAQDGGRFTDASSQAGPGLAVRRSSRGAVAGDVDGDGDLDVVISNVDAPPTLLRNDTHRRGSWLIVDAPGARRIVVETAHRHHVHDVVAGGSFVSATDPRVHFGLGPVKRFERVVVTWPDGEETVRTDDGGAVDRVLRITR